MDSAHDTPFKYRVKLTHLSWMGRDETETARGFNYWVYSKIITAEHNISSH